jgi:hypothetical protein
LLLWLFGWLPRSQLAKIEDLKEVFIHQQQDDDDEEEMSTKV